MVVAPVTSDESEQDRQENTDESADFGEQIRRNSKKKKKNQTDEFAKGEIIKESELKNHKGVTGTVTSSEQIEDDRVLHTSFKLSPYSINLISMIKKYNSISNSGLKILSRPKVILDVTSSSIDRFLDLMIERYNTISDINQLAREINASSGKVSILQPKLKLEMNNEEENEYADALILSSALTKIKMLSEEFCISPSCIVEYLIYMYVCGSESNSYDSSKRYCEERMNLFISQLDKFISDCTTINTEDENALIKIAYKMAAANIKESTRTNNNFKDRCHKTIDVDVGSEYNINTKLILSKKSMKKNFDESHSKGIFRQKTGRKSEKESKEDELRDGVEEKDEVETL